MPRPQMRRRQTPQSVTGSASASTSGDSNPSPATSPGDGDDTDSLATSQHAFPFTTTSTSHAGPLGQDPMVDVEQDEDGGFDDAQNNMFSNADFFSHFGLQPDQQHALAMQLAAPQNGQGQAQGQTQDSMFSPGFSSLANLGVMNIHQPPTPPGSSLSSVAGMMGAAFSQNNTMDNSPPATVVSQANTPKTPQDKDQASAAVGQCSCLNDRLRVIQQLDDDHFRITTLSLDQVLQLQKWLMSQCDKSLQCSSCHLLPSVHSVLVIICDRLTEMFECIHKRIKRLHQHIADKEAAGEVDDASYPAQLFCGSTGEIAGMATCNPALFKPAFRESYSPMEQIHMMKALLNMQVKSFEELLVRLRSPLQALGSQARLSKMSSLFSRMERAGAKIDDELQIILARNG
ncbi:hypothetical protein PG985_003215 [Apiospora marii]|uniref:uncharacterized protein n=1 Tax=Apiospora marii TaxID=335849 RepID=UPI00312F1398